MGFVGTKDTSYQRLFSHPEMVRDLLIGFVKEPWIQRVDFSTLQPYKSSFVSDRLRKRRSDVVWRVRLHDEWLYVFIVLEFQSKPDTFMALRVLAYVVLLYQDIVRKERDVRTGKQKLPPILPMVLFNGSETWRASTEVADLIQRVPGGLEGYLPSFRYLLIDEKKHSGIGEKSQKNLVEALFQLENTREPRSIQRVVIRLLKWLGAPDQAELSRSFATWFNEVLVPRQKFPERIPAFQDIQEVKSMLQETVQKWYKEAEQKGMREGKRKGKIEGKKEGKKEGKIEGKIEGKKEGKIEGKIEGKKEGKIEGKKEGKKEGLVKLILSLLEAKFGKISVADRKIVRGAETETLLEWGTRILTAESIDDVFDG